MIMLHVDIIYLAFRGEKNRMHDRYILATRIFNVKFEWSIWLERIWCILNQDILYVYLYFYVLKTALSQGEKEFLEKVFLEAQDVVSSPKLRDRFLKFCVHPTKQICPRSIFLSKKIEKNFFKPHLAKVEEVLFPL